MELRGKVVWVVGASSGIGAATASELEARGATVAISARREQELERVSCGRMLVVPVDVTDAAAVAAAVDRVREVHGRIDVAVLAGDSPLGPFMQVRAGFTISFAVMSTGKRP